MSTRCQVRVIANGKNVMLYHHWDGYPEGVGYCLLKILKKAENKRWADEFVNKMITKGNFEITFGNHCDIEYYYELDFDKQQVNCMAVNNWGNKMEILEHIALIYNEEKDVKVDEEIFEGV